MKYFKYISEGSLKSLFYRAPTRFGKTADRDLLRRAVGGLLYTPGFSDRIAQGIIEGRVSGLTSLAICLEDSIADDQCAACEANVAHQLALLQEALADGRLASEGLPLLFVRVKDIPMLERLSALLIRYSRLLTGVILPKVTEDTLERFLNLTDDIGNRAADPFYAMPILESVELMHCDDRIGLLHKLLSIMDAHPERVLNVRVGATDLCGLYGIRRRIDTPIYSIPLIAGCISDVVRVFALEDRYTVSGPVWEYFSTSAHTRTLRNWREIDGLVRETALDLQNGLLGKTCIHPTQLLPVQASYVVPFEAWQDAQSIWGGGAEGGVLASERHNKMNELKPHRLWARKILRQAEIYGVYQENVDSTSLLGAMGVKECAG